MKNNTRRIIFALILALTMLVGMTVTSFAADGTTVYLEPGDFWTADNARFAVYYWTSDNNNGWVDMTDADNDGTYEATIPAGYSNIIFVRLDPNSSDNSWDNKWNQTADLTAYDGDTFVISDSNGSGSWKEHASSDDSGSNSGNSGEVTDTDYEASSYTVAGVSGLCGAEWNPGEAANDMVYNKDTGLYEKTFTGISAGTYSFKVAADHAWDHSWGDPVNGVGQFGTDYQIILDEEQDVTITIDPKTKEINVKFSPSTGSAADKFVDSTEEREVVLDNVAGWDEVFVYYWDTAISGAVTWPGEPMELREDGYYYATIPEGMCGIIFNNGSNEAQTRDLVIPDADNNFFKNDNLAGNWELNPSKVVEAPKEMTFLQKLAKALLLFLRSIEDFFKKIFPAAKK